MEKMSNAFLRLFVLCLSLARMRPVSATRESSRQRHRRFSSQWGSVLYEMFIFNPPPKMRNFLPVFGVKGRLGYGVNHDHTLTCSIKKATVSRHVRTAAQKSSATSSAELKLWQTSVTATNVISWGTLSTHYRKMVVSAERLQVEYQLWRDQSGSLKYLVHGSGLFNRQKVWKRHYYPTDVIRK